MRNFSKLLLITLGVALVTASFVLTGMWIAKRQIAATTSQNAEGIEPVAVIREVSKLIELPNDEEPSVAIVRDVEKLKDQEIFRNAKNGDVLLIYVKAKRAYLYDREKGKLVDVAPVNVTNGSQSSPTGE